MAAWIDTRWFWTLLILTLCGEFLLPCLLARKDPAYRPGTMAVSVLGQKGRSRGPGLPPVAGVAGDMAF